MNYSQAVKIKLPHQDLDAPTLFAPDGEALRAWLAELPRANLGQTTRSLFQALTELNRVRLTPGRRLELLEPIRPQLYFAVGGLAKYYLNQPIVLPEHSRKVAQLAQTLFEQLAHGYSLVATHTAALGKRSGLARPNEVIALALQRALTDHSQNLLRWQQLYRSPADGFWQQLHQLYQLAEERGVTDLHQRDAECGDTSPRGAYLRALLLGCARPNQLRQGDLSDVFTALTGWSKRVATAPIKGSTSLFVVDTSGDDCPVYRADHQDGIDQGFSLETAPLVEHLQTLREGATGDYVEKEGRRISSDLLGHLILAWGMISKRTFMRLEASEQVAIAIGLSTTHHFIAGGERFESLVQNGDSQRYAVENDNVFLRQRREAVVRQRDVWDSPYESNLGRASIALESIDYHIQSHTKSQSASSERYRSHRVELVNVSPGGYCLKWPPDDAAQVRTGEIIGVREAHSKSWSIAVIRWVRQNEEDYTQLGVELLSPAAHPYGARVISSGGIYGEFQRVLLLPEIKPVGKPVTLLTPKLGFREQQKVGLMQRGRETKVQLTRKIASSGAFSQFEFRRLKSVSHADEPGASDSGFDGLWDNL